MQQCCFKFLCCMQRQHNTFSPIRNLIYMKFWYTRFLIGWNLFLIEICSFSTYAFHCVLSLTSLRIRTEFESNRRFWASGYINAPLFRPPITCFAGTQVFVKVTLLESFYIICGAYYRIAVQHYSYDSVSLIYKNLFYY